jgi:regulator of replication initiation timing
VRKAQYEHRQRKENYVKELERDVDHFRDAVTQAKKEVLALQQENQTMRDRLKSAGIALPTVQPQITSIDEQIETPPSQNLQAQPGQPTNPQLSLFPAVPAAQQRTLSPPQVPQPSYRELSWSSPSTTANTIASTSLDDFTVTLSMDEIMGTPSFKISASPPSSNVLAATSPVSEGGPRYSAQQEQLAVNFILAYVIRQTLSIWKS